MTLDTWRPGRKQQARQRHILAIETCRQQLQAITGNEPTMDGIRKLLSTPESYALSAKIKYHEIQERLWCKSIADFGDEEV